MNDEETEILGPSAKLLPPTPRRPGSLTTLEHVRGELARVYRDAREGRIETRDASRLAFILTALAKIIESGEAERRLDELEIHIKELETSKGRY